MHHIVVEQQARARMEDLLSTAEARRRLEQRAPASGLRPGARVRAGRILVRLGASLAGPEAGPQLRRAIPVPCATAAVDSR